jgi:RNA polymerase sigma-70 factor, ECF subfamily
MMKRRSLPSIGGNLSRRLFEAAEQEDQQLIASISRGDEDALQTLVHKYSRDLYQFVFSSLHDHDLSQQAVSNVFISLWQHRHRLNITRNVYAYLFTCTTNESFRIFRKHTRPEEVPIDDVLADELLGDDRVDKEVQFNEFLSDIEAELEKMPMERQKVFRMSGFENIGYKEIASALGISVSGVQKHMIRARTQLAAKLPKLGYPFKQDPGL